MSLIARLTKTPEGLRLYQQERALLELTEMIYEAMEAQKICRNELGGRIGQTREFIGERLDGDVDVTVREASTILTALGYDLHFSCERREP